MEHLHVRGLPSDCVECPERSKKREGEEVLEMDLVIDDEESVEKSFYSTRGSEAGEEGKEGDGVDEGSNR